jgi:hypothetical protein
MTTKTNMALAELTEKGADADLLREMIQFVAQRMMEMDTESLCAAAYGERSPERANSRTLLSTISGWLTATQVGPRGSPADALSEATSRFPSFLQFLPVETRGRHW